MQAQEPCESGGGRPGLPVPNSPYGLCGRKATLKNRAQPSRAPRREQSLWSLWTQGNILEQSPAVQGSPSRTVLMVSVDARQHFRTEPSRPGLPVPNSPYGLCGRKATLNLDLNADQFSSVPTQAKTFILVSRQSSAEAMTMVLYTFLFSWASFLHSSSIFFGKVCFIK